MGFTPALNLIFQISIKNLVSHFKHKSLFIEMKLKKKILQKDKAEVHQLTYIHNILWFLYCTNTNEFEYRI